MNKYANYALKTHHEYGFRTLLISRSGTIADGVLSFDGEKETTGERGDAIQTGFVAGRRSAYIAVSEDDEPPDEGEEKPGENEGKCEHK